VDCQADEYKCGKMLLPSKCETTKNPEYGYKKAKRLRSTTAKKEKNNDNQNQKN